MKASQCILLIGVFATVLSAASFTRESTAFAAGKASESSTESARPIDAAFDRLTELMSGWEVIQRDEEPSVDVDGAMGYRIVFVRKGTYAQHRADGRHVLLASIEDRKPETTYADFVLFKADGPAPEDPAAIPWTNRKPANDPRDMFLGRGMGLVWFARAPLLRETRFIRDLGLAGADTAALWISGLTSSDPETAWRCAGELAHLRKEDALPDIEKALSQRRAAGLRDGPLIMALAGIRNERADELLREAYRGDCKDFAEYALSGQPYRRETKDLYLAMLEDGREVHACARAAVEFGWVDFKPLLETIVASPSLAYDFEAAFTALRALDGRPIPESAIEARNNILEHPDSNTWQINESAAAVITSMEDKEAAAMLAVSLLSRLHWKGMQQRAPHLSEAAKVLISRLPKEVTLPLIEAIAAKYDAREERYKGGFEQGAIAQLRLTVMEMGRPPRVIRPMTNEEFRGLMGPPGVKTREEFGRVLGCALSEESPGPLVTGVDAVGLFKSLAPDYRELRGHHYRRSVGIGGASYIMTRQGSDPEALEGRAFLTLGVFENREKAVMALGRACESLSGGPGLGLVGLGDRAYCAMSAQSDYANLRFRRKNVVVHLGLPLPEDEAIALAGRMDAMLESDIMFVTRGEKVVVPQAVLKGFPARLKHGESAHGELEILDANPEDMIVRGAVGLGVPDKTLAYGGPNKVSEVTFVALGEGAGKVEVFIANQCNSVTTTLEHEIAIEP